MILFWKDFVARILGLDNIDQVMHLKDPSDVETDFFGARPGTYSNILAASNHSPRSKRRDTNHFELPALVTTLVLHPVLFFLFDPRTDSDT